MSVGFFDSLYRDPDFCQALGRVTLAAGRFESDLRTYLRIRGIPVSDQETFGPLVDRLQTHRMLTETGIRVLRELQSQRDYLTHSLFDLFAARIEETVLPRDGLTPSDMWTYREKALELEQNLLGFVSLVEDAISRLNKLEGIAGVSDELLFRP